VAFAVCFIHDKNGKPGTLDNTKAAAVAFREINPGQVVYVFQGYDCPALTGIHARVAGNFLEALHNGNRPLGETIFGWHYSGQIFFGRDARID
jgi:hypothetical protein